MKAKNGNKLENSGGRYCNLENKDCRKYGRVFSDDGGYICAYCGGRVSKWIPFVEMMKDRKRNNK